jgi:hypothetical protein
LAFVPSSLMLGVTTHVTTDISPIPLLWILPLTLYLLSFVLAFSRLPGGLYRGSAILFALLVAMLIAIQIDRLGWLHITWHLELSQGQLIGLHLFAFFIAALICHGDLAQRRPSTARLTEYYLVIALGGMLGGVFNSILAPWFFDRIIEYPLLFGVVFLLCPSVRSWGDSKGTASYRREWIAGWLVYGILTAMCFAVLTIDQGAVEIRRVRNFFGTLLASHNKDSGLSALSHGTTIHGMQNLSNPARRRDPLLYFTKSSGIGRVFLALDERPKTVGVIGLGAGTVACYAGPGQHWIFYEINPAVLRLARDASFFTYLHDAESRGVEVQVVLGDGRLSIDSNPTIHDVLIIDAFSSDAIPVHLLTREALQIYLSKLSAHGLLVFHITNRFVDLTPVLADLARELGLISVFYSHEESNCNSWWMVLARNKNDLGSLAYEPRWRRFRGSPTARVWTDDFSNIYSAFWPRGVGDVPQASLEP